MAKKILFFGVAIILGFMIMVMAYSGFQMSDVQSAITGYMAEDDYKTLSWCFLTYYNEGSLTELASYDNEGVKFDIVGVESIFSEETVINYNGGQTDGYRYQDGYTFFFNHLSGVDYEGHSGSDGVVVNDTRLVFKNGDTYSYEFYFNEESENEDEDGRNYTELASQIGFLEFDLSTDVIETELGGQITGLSFYNGKNVLVTDITFASPITLTSDYYTLTGELVEAWDLCIDTLATDEAASDTYSAFYDRNEEGTGWLDRYTANENYKLGMSSYSDLIGNSPIVKTVVVMVVYLVICIVLGYFVLKDKQKMPKPYVRDQYKKQVIQAKQPVEVVEEVKEKPTNEVVEETPVEEETVEETSELPETTEVKEDTSSEVETTEENKTE